MILQGLFNILDLYFKEMDLFYNNIDHYFREKINAYFEDHLINESIIDQKLKELSQYLITLFDEIGFEKSEIENEFISGLAEIGGIGIENARMYDHLKDNYDILIRDIHQRFEYGRRA